MGSVMRELSKNRTVLGADCRVTGELTLDNDAVVMGRFDGRLQVTGRLDLTETSHVTGTIIAGELRLSGNVKATIIAKESIELLAGSNVEGRLYSPHLGVAEGAVLVAEVHIGPHAMQTADALILNETLPPATRPATDPIAATPSPSPSPFMAMAMPSSDDEPEPMVVIADDSDVADGADEAVITTVPRAVQSMLHHRRPVKIITALRRPPVPDVDPAPSVPQG